MRGGRSIDELIQALSINPDDSVMRCALVESLLDAQRIEEASKHFDLLKAMSGESPRVLALGIQVFTAQGDLMQAARYRKKLNSYSDNDDDDSDEIDEISANHPANGSTSRIDFPKLRLVSETFTQNTALTQKPTFKLDDLVGLKTIKQNLKEIIESVNSNDHEGWVGGVLFYGPPHCGKAFLGEIIASELNASLYFFDLSQDWESRLFCRAIDGTLNENSESTKVIYLRNIDSEGAQKILQDPIVLDSLDKAQTHAKVVIIGSATFPWLATNNVVCSQRLRRVLLVLPPDAPARRAFLRTRFKQLSIAFDQEAEWIVKHSEGHSFGDLDRLIQNAVSTSLSTNTFHNDSKLILNHNAVRKARQQVNSSSSEWLTTAGHHAFINAEGGLYDDLLTYFRERTKNKQPNNY